MKERREHSVSELIKDGVLSIGDGYRAKNVELSASKDTGLPFARAGNIDGGFDFTNADFFPTENLRKVGEKISKEGDTVFTSKGTVGRFAFVNDSSTPFVYSPQLCYWRSLNKKIISPRYLFYWMHGREFFEQANSVKGQTDMADYVNLSDQRQMKITLPEISEQNLIAEVLSSIDESIELLVRQNKILEQLAEALFRQKFIEETKSDSIFLNEYAECINGVSYKSSELNPSKVGMISLKSFDRKGGFSIDGFKEFTGKFKEKQIVVEGDLIVAHTDITQEAEVIGNPALVINNPNFETMIISMDIVKVVSKLEWISNEFLYYLMKTREFKSHCEGCANGSTVLHLSKQAIPTFELPVPEKEKVIEFTRYTKDLLRKSFSNHAEIRTLTKLKETVLPKLVSGEVTVNLN